MLPGYELCPTVTGHMGSNATMKIANGSQRLYQRYARINSHHHIALCSYCLKLLQFVQNSKTNVIGALLDWFVHKSHLVMDSTGTGLSTVPWDPCSWICITFCQAWVCDLWNVYSGPCLCWKMNPNVAVPNIVWMLKAILFPWIVIGHQCDVASLAIHMHGTET